MKKIIVLSLIAAFVAVGAIAAFASDNGPAEVKLDTPKMGKSMVVFPHAKHQALGKECTVCHHNGMEKPKCTECHGVDAKAPSAKQAFHKLCIDCHTSMAKGPQKKDCKVCHTKG